MIVIGICGTNGSGKGTVAEYLFNYLKDKTSVEYIKAREVILNLAKEKGINIESRTDMNLFTEELNRTGGSLIYQFLVDNKQKNTIYIIESIRRVREIKNIREICPNSLIISVDADIEKRYERIVLRKSVTDVVDIEKFKEEEEKESSGMLETEMNIKDCISMSDIKITNNGDYFMFEKEILDKVINNDRFKKLVVL